MIFTAIVAVTFFLVVIVFCVYDRCVIANVVTVGRFSQSLTRYRFFKVCAGS
jgi:hypothetical protein